jgi:outer membrane protein TolC
MKWIGCIAALLLAFSFAAGSLDADELKLDLHTALLQARTYNLGIQAEQIDLETVSRASRNSWNEFLPSLNVSTGLSRSGSKDASTDSTADAQPWQFSAGVSAGLSLSTAPRYRIQETRLAYRAGEITYEDAVKQLERDVKKAFYQVILKRETIGLIEQNMGTAEKRYLQEKEGYEKGLVSELTMLNAQVAYENLKPELEEAQVAYRTAESELKQMVGLERTSDISVHGTLETPELSLNLENLISEHLQERFDVRAQVNTVQALENQKKLAAAEEFSPTLSLSYGYSTALNDPFHAEWAGRDEWSGRSTVGLSLSLSLDGLVPGSSSKTRVREAEDSVRKADLELRQTVQDAELEIETLVLQIQKSKRTIQVLERNIELAEKTYDLTEQEYRAGITGLLELEEVNDNLREAMLNWIQESYAYLDAVFDLEYALNTELYL